MHWLPQELPLQILPRRQGSILFGGRNVTFACDPSPKDKEKAPTDKVVKVLLGNLTSLSPKMENYLFRPSVNKNVILYGLLEAHKTIGELESLKSKFNSYGRSLVLNPAILTGRSETGNHGGEIASARNDTDFVKFQDQVINQIQTESGDTVHFSGGIFRFRNFSIVFVFLYLVTSVGMNDENSRRMEQVNILLKILGLPFIIYSDFNMLPDELSKSGWPQFLKAEIVTPIGATSTLKKVSGRIIDYLLVHRSILGVVQSLMLNSIAPSTPHYFLDLTLMANPRFIIEPTFCIPSKLPSDIFIENWKAFDD